MIDIPKISNHSDFIESLRGILGLWVLFAHLVGWTIFVQGAESIPYFLNALMKAFVFFFQTSGETHPAVLGFITLSGYCIHRNGLRRFNFNLREYAIRRFFRIYPIYALAIIIGMLCFQLNKSSSEKIAIILNNTTHLSPAYLLAKLSGISAFIPTLHEKTMQGNAPLHTVMVEMWLYVLYPLLFGIFLKKNNEIRLWILLFSIWLGGACLVSFNPALKSWWDNGSVFGFIIYWWIGAKFNDKHFANQTMSYLKFFILLFLSLSFFVCYTKTELAILIELKKLVFCILFSLFLYKYDLIKNSILKKLSYIGKPSYSLYAFHAPIIQFLIINKVHYLISFLIIFCFSILLFKFVETPLINYGKRYAQKFNLPNVNA